MSQLTTNKVKLGSVADQTKNFNIDASAADGTLKIQRASGQDILTVDSSGRVAMPNNVVAFSAWQSVAQSTPSGAATKIQLQTEEFDTSNAFDSTTNFRFQPQVAGYYQITGATTLAVSNSSTAILYKNGSLFKEGCPGLRSVVTALVYLNGTTDYLELFMWQQVGTAQNTAAASDDTYFQGILIAKV